LLLWHKTRNLTVLYALRRLFNSHNPDEQTL
jgi:hypothetical protein